MEAEIVKVWNCSGPDKRHTPDQNCRFLLCKKSGWVSGDLSHERQHANLHDPVAIVLPLLAWMLLLGGLILCDRMLWLDQHKGLLLRYQPLVWRGGLTASCTEIQPAIRFCFPYTSSGNGCLESVPHFPTIPTQQKRVTGELLGHIH